MSGPRAYLGSALPARRGLLHRGDDHRAVRRLEAAAGRLFGDQHFADALQIARHTDRAVALAGDREQRVGRLGRPASRLSATPHRSARAPAPACPSPGAARASRLCAAPPWRRDRRREAGPAPGSRASAGSSRVLSASAPISTPAARAPVAASAGNTRQRQAERARAGTIGLVAGCPQQLGLAVHDSHQPPTQLGRRLGAGHGDRQRVGHPLQLCQLLATLRAGLEMLPEGLHLVLVERAERICADIDASLALILARRTHESTCMGPSCNRSFCRPSRMRPLIVPIGVSSIVAISLWLKPP